MTCIQLLSCSEVGNKRSLLVYIYDLMSRLMTLIDDWYLSYGAT